MDGTIAYIIGCIIGGLIWGAICNAVGKSKNVKGFWWGFFLGLIGLIVVLCMKPNQNN